MHPGFSQDPAGVDDFEDLISLEWKNIKRLLGHGSRPHGAILVVIVSVSFNGEKRTLLFLSHEQRWLVCVTPVDTFRENAGTHKSRPVCSEKISYKGSRDSRRDWLYQVVSKRHQTIVEFATPSCLRFCWVQPSHSHGICHLLGFHHIWSILGV